MASVHREIEIGQMCTELLKVHVLYTILDKKKPIQPLTCVKQTVEAASVHTLSQRSTRLAVCNNTVAIHTQIWLLLRRIAVMVLAPAFVGTGRVVREYRQKSLQWGQFGGCGSDRGGAPRRAP